MEENRQNDNRCDNDKVCHMIKFAVLLVTLFLACYLAVYYIMDQIRHSYYLPAMPLENIDKIIEEQDRLFEKELGTFPMQSRALKQMKSPVETYKDDKINAYKIIVNLKDFDNNPKNITLDIKKDSVNITGVSEKTGKTNEKLYTFSQSFDLPEEIDTKSVTKEQSGSKYIITLPIENPLNDIDDDD